MGLSGVQVWAMETGAPGGSRIPTRTPGSRPPPTDAPGVVQPTGAWWLVRRVLAERLGVPPEEPAFERTASGRPVLSEPWAHSGLHFSLTRTDGAVLVAVTARAPVGVDLERERPIPLATQIAARFFATAEVVRVGSADEPARSREFLALWTMKEAAAKAQGDGLVPPFTVLSRPVATGAAHVGHTQWVGQTLRLAGGLIGAVVIGWGQEVRTP